MKRRRLRGGCGGGRGSGRVEERSMVRLSLSTRGGGGGLVRGLVFVLVLLVRGGGSEHLGERRGRWVGGLARS